MLAEAVRPALVPAPRKRLVVAPSPKGRKPGRQYEAVRLVVDDHGDAVSLQWRCSSCADWHANGRGWCRDCRRWSSQQTRERDRERARALARRARVRRYERDPMARKRDQARNTAMKRRFSEANPVLAAERRSAANRRWLEKVRSDPVRYRKRVELMRVDNVLRRMDTGKVAQLRTEGASGTWERKYVPSAPLARAAERSGHRPADVAEMAGFTDKVLRNWRTGEQRLATWGAADMLIVGLDLGWWEVFDPEDAAPRMPLCRWAVTDRAQAAMSASAPRRCAGSSGAFSGVRSRDVVAWIAAAEAAALLWDGGEWPVHCTGCGWRGEREGTDPVDACESGCPECRGALAAGWPSTPAPLPLALAVAR